MAELTLPKTTIELPPQLRYLSLPVIESESTIVDADTREVTFAFSSEAPVQRINWDIWEYIYEVLDHSPESANLDRCNTGAAPLLWNHNRHDQRGIIKKAWIDAGERRAWCTARFSRSEPGEQLLQDVNDQIIQNVSFMYLVKELELTTIREDDYNTYTSRDWEVIEISFVSIPADPSVGVGRSSEGQEKNRVIVRGYTPAGDQPMTVEANPPSSDQDLRQRNQDLERQVAELKQQQQQAARQQQTRDKYSTLKDQARTLLDNRKLSTAAYEAMFSEKSLQRYLEEGNTELSGVEYHLKQVEKYGSAPANLGPSSLQDEPLPPHPSERQENGGNNQPTQKADSFLEGHQPRKPY